MALSIWERQEVDAGRADDAGAADGLLGPAGRAVLTALPAADAPASAAHETALLAAACRAPVFLRCGLWPINPLCVPEIVRFCEWLPVEWRRSRRLHRERLVRAGLSPRWPQPRRRENFAHVMDAGMRRHGLGLLEALAPVSLLANLGYIDPAALAARAAAAAGTDGVWTGLYEFVDLELGLRQLLYGAGTVG